MAKRSLREMIAEVKSRSEIRSAGMLLCHNGFVRATSRAGKGVESLRVSADTATIREIRQWALSQPGIVAVEIEALEGEFKVGDDLLYVVVAGDIREHVFDTMRATVERIKTEGVSKSERLLGG
ncbi:MAG: molybdenum cofactor biosynthesis protein MoaE [Thermodesulfobacteriota bacterium]